MPILRSSHKNEAADRSDRKEKQEAVEIWRAEDFRPIELHRGASITVDYARHWHDELYLCAIIDDGGSDLDCKGSSYRTPPGALVLLPSGEIHANRKRRCTFRCMFIEFQALQTAVEQFTERAVPGINFRPELIHNAATTSSFLRLHRSLEKPRSRLQRDSAILRFFHRLVTRHSTANIPAVHDGNEDFAVQRTKRFLDEHYSEHVSLQDLARLTGLSPYYLHRSFCRKVGMPPHAYQLQVRISRARSLLRRGQSISDAAFSAGFVDQSHFARNFKKFTGVTPGKFLRLEQERTRPSARQALTSLS